MSELLTLYGQTDHGPADPLPICHKRGENHPGSAAFLDRMDAIHYPSDPPDPPGLCPRCKRECRDFTSVGGNEYCKSCAEMVRDIKSLFRDCQALGTGEP